MHDLEDLFPYELEPLNKYSQQNLENYQAAEERRALRRWMRRSLPIIIITSGGIYGSPRI